MPEQECLTITIAAQDKSTGLAKEWPVVAVLEGTDARGLGTDIVSAVQDLLTTRAGALAVAWLEKQTMRAARRHTQPQTATHHKGGLFETTENAELEAAELK